MKKEKRKQSKNRTNGTNCVHKAFLTQPISQRNSTGEGNVAIPNDDNVTANKNWVDENKL